MKITSKLSFKYIKENKNRSMITIVRNQYCNNTCCNSINTSIKLSKLHG